MRTSFTNAHILLPPVRNSAGFSTYTKYLMISLTKSWGSAGMWPHWLLNNSKTAPRLFVEKKCQVVEYISCLEIWRYSFVNMFLLNILCTVSTLTCTLRFVRICFDMFTVGLLWTCAINLDVFNALFVIVLVANSESQLGILKLGIQLPHMPSVEG